ncbi:peptidylprolyl isomerase [Catenovulum sediminis]|uniref:Peptidyl-prolyl cis-trans isomerase n=1 Tax=Catenovulum sediminis TaxID=1740262 RepID=A0ABV1RIC1_9ALTE|nr:peptidylprolyl isomerase [Catenovulum sediminis]
MPKINLSQLLICVLCVFSSPSFATIVLFKTSLGDFEVNLYDETTPKTVENFLSYVTNGTYTNTLIHRAPTNFVIQGGGFFINENDQLEGVETSDPVINEPVYANIKGTIAMAKLGGDENSATSQWFFNMADNTGNLDSQNGGFTVFGEVTGNGMEILEAIGALPVYYFSSSFSQVPLRDYTTTDAENQVTVTNDNFVYIEEIVVVNANVDTAADLSPTETTRDETSTPDNPERPDNNNGTSGSSGGSFPAIALGLLSLLSISRRAKGRRRTAC